MGRFGVFLVLIGRRLSMVMDVCKILVFLGRRVEQKNKSERAREREREREREFRMLLEQDLPRIYNKGTVGNDREIIILAR